MPKEHKKYVAYKQEWTESERGWGQRPDGSTIHLSLEDHKVYVEGYNKAFNNEKTTPSCYTFADGAPKLIEVTEEQFSRLTKNKESLNESQSFTFQRFGVWL